MDREKLVGFGVKPSRVSCLGPRRGEEWLLKGDWRALYARRRGVDSNGEETGKCGPGALIRFVL